MNDVDVARGELGDAYLADRRGRLPATLAALGAVLGAWFESRNADEYTFNGVSAAAALGYFVGLGVCYERRGRRALAADVDAPAPGTIVVDGDGNAERVE